MSAEDAESLIRAGWTQLGEWTDDEGGEDERINEPNTPEGPKITYAPGSERIAFSSAILPPYSPAAMCAGTTPSAAGIRAINSGITLAPRTDACVKTMVWCPVSSVGVAGTPERAKSLPTTAIPTAGSPAVLVNGGFSKETGDDGQQ